MTVVNTAVPVISGTAKQGNLLSVSNGSWTHDLAELIYTYRWLRCDAVGASCVAITGATSSTYRVAAADVGSTLRAEVTATEQAAPSPPPPSSGLRYGLNASKWYDSQHNPNLVAGLGATIVRHEESIGSSASSLDARFAMYKNAGIEVLYQVGIPDGGAPTTAQAQNCGLVATRHGPSGTASINFIEFGNETSYAYQLPGDPYPVGQAYALRAKEAAISMTGTGVGLLVQIDSGLRGAAWANGMFNAVPDLDDYVAGWTIHPYGPTWGPQRIDQAKSDFAAHGVATYDIYFTEWGVASDNGRTLDDNYGWPKNMTYQQASDALVSSEAVWDSKLGDNLKLVVIYRDFDNAAPGASTGREAYFGVVKSDGSDKGAYATTIRARL